ncbi:FkbM family methyltransferase [Acidiferrimicrobium sp. IK]|uniref:FkbM family methyltransferase n=1 Tax=Acidiferrimicrobium sp. IK TaxID=2871700 RepID=UPI0021CAFA73|nr:FkbM family methyltransferase [Acidiferrimicrobium sp. IK]MCU4185058.1 FkbM family methyltransferase [Acidiferrimicrobium sp. IK]
MVKYYYAQNREDLLIKGFFPDVAAGTYVDVGANDPVIDSVTKLFYDAGWAGINIEPQAALFEALVTQRPRDVNLNIGVGAQAGALVFTEFPEGNGLSTFDRTVVHRLQNVEHNHAARVSLEREVEVRTLGAVIRDTGLRHLHVMKIDVEGFEYEVLLGMDWNGVRPELICIEANKISPERDWRRLLSGLQYSSVFFDGINDYWLAPEAAYRQGFFNYPVAVLSDSPIYYPAAVALEREMRASVAAESRPAPPAETRPLHLVLDVQVLQSEARHRGMGRYVLSLIEALDTDAIHCSFLVNTQLPPLDARSRAVLDAKGVIVDLPLLHPRSGVGFVQAREENRRAVTGAVADLARSRPAGRVVFVITALFGRDAYPVFPGEGTTNLLVFYDLIPYLFPGSYLIGDDAIDYSSRFSEVYRADHFACDSQSAAQDLTVHLGVDPNRITPVLGASAFLPDIVPARPPFAHDLGRFALVACGNDQRKNNEATARAFAAVGGEVTPVFTSSYPAALEQHLRAICPQAIFAGQLPDAEMLWLTDNAEFVFFPSIYEGLGLPILEAVDRGTPVVCSQIPSFTEISETAFSFFDPDSLPSMIEALSAAVATRRDRSVVPSGYEQMRARFNWPACATRFADAVDKAQPAARVGRLAMIAPSPATSSAVGKYALRMYAELSREFEVDYFGETGSRGVAAVGFNLMEHSGLYFPAGAFADRAQRYDHVVYHLANDELHTTAATSAFLRPGAVIIHDTRLDELLGAAVETGAVPAELRVEVAAVDAALAMRRSSCLAWLAVRQELLAATSTDSEEAVAEIALVLDADRGSKVRTAALAFLDENHTYAARAKRLASGIREGRAADLSPAPAQDEPSDQRSTSTPLTGELDAAIKAFDDSLESGAAPAPEAVADAWRAFRAALESSDIAQIRIASGDHLRSGEPALSEEVVQRGIHLWGRHPDLLVEAAVVCAQTGQLDRASSLCDEALRAWPAHAEAAATRIALDVALGRRAAITDIAVGSDLTPAAGELHVVEPGVAHGDIQAPLTEVPFAAGSLRSVRVSGRLLGSLEANERDLAVAHLSSLLAPGQEITVTDDETRGHAGGRGGLGYGVYVEDEDRYRSCAKVSLRAHLSPDSTLVESRDGSSISASYNDILDSFSGDDRPRAVVLMHEDVSIIEPDFEEKIQAAFLDDDVAIVGVVGGAEVSGMEWWSGKRYGRCSDNGTGLIDFGGGDHDVEIVDGLLMALSPWAVRNLRFDASNFPGARGYDADICFQAQAAGKKVRVIDLPVFHHDKPGPIDQLAFGQAQAAFASKWASALAAGRSRWVAADAPAAPAGRVLTPLPGRDAVRILFVDDRIPNPELGCGYGRSYDTLCALAEREGTSVVFHPGTPGGRGPAVEGVEVVEDLAGYLARPGVDFDVVIVSRPHNVLGYGGYLTAKLPSAVKIYDAEALFFRRLEMQAELAAGAAQTRFSEMAAAAKAEETSALEWGDFVVCISRDEAAIASALSGKPVRTVNPRLRSPSVTSASFAGRAGIGLVAGWAAGAGSPNVDGLRWFVTEVLPLVRQRVPHATLRVTGGQPPAEVVALQDIGVVELVGLVPDIEHFYNSVRVAISPTRFGAGVKIKTVEAIQHGVPVVATEEAAGGLSPALRSAVAVASDAHRFAEEVIALLEDEAAWTRQREMSLRALERDLAEPDPLRVTWGEMIDIALDKKRTTTGSAVVAERVGSGVPC